MDIHAMRKRTLAVALVFLLGGCAHLGPGTISPDRVEYVQDITESWKKQMLLNIVKLRYYDAPTFLDVSSIINQYGIENQVNADMRWYWPIPSTSGYQAGAGGYSRYSDRPTITYTPLSGQKFTKSLLTPIPPGAIVSLVQNGWPIDRLFSITVKSVNGIRNSSALAVSAPGEGEEFAQLMEAMRRLQQDGVVDIRSEKFNAQETVIFVVSDDVTREQYREESQTIFRILGIPSGQQKYSIVSGTLPSNDQEIAILTRSMLEIMLEIAGTVEVPAAHVADGRVFVTPSGKTPHPIVIIHSGREKPSDTYAAVQYREHWFWIDDKDLDAKRNFSMLMIFLSLTETEQKGAAPLLSL